MEWEKIATLLDVVHKASTAGPEFGWIAARARVELGKFHEVKAEIQPPTPDPTYRETQLDLALKGKL